MHLAEYKGAVVQWTTRENNFVLAGRDLYEGPALILHMLLFHTAVSYQRYRCSSLLNEVSCNSFFEKKS